MRENGVVLPDLMSRTPPLRFRPDIEGLRAVAILLVLIFHFDLVASVGGGFMGVDVFFVISGFLIASIIRRQLQTGTFRLRTFWIQRIRRLAPALLATTFLTAAVGWAMLLPADYVRLAEQTIAAQFYVANIFFWRNVNYFGLGAHDVYLLHTWSLAVEEQFYLLFPLLMLVVAPWSRRNVLLALGVLGIVSMSLGLGFIATKPEAVFYLAPTRAWELLSGSLLSIGLETSGFVSARRAAWTGALGFGCIAIAVVTYQPQIAFPGLFALWPTLGTVLLIYAGNDRMVGLSRLLGSRPFTDLGRISYPLYLVHWPVNVLSALQFGAGYNWKWRAAMLVLSTALAAVIQRCIERPARHWLEKIRPRGVAGIYGASLGCVLMLSMIVVRTGGVPSRFSADIVKLAAYAQDSPPPMNECQYVAGRVLDSTTLCRLGSLQGQPQWFIYGDSHAWAASGAFDLWLKRTGQSAYFAFVHSCPPLVDIHLFRGGTECHAFNSAVRNYMRAAGSPQRVFLVSAWRQAIEGRLSTSEDRKLSSKESLALFDRQLVATIDEWRRLDKHVYVWEPVPGARDRVPQEMVRRLRGGQPRALAFSRDAYLADAAYFFDALLPRRSLLDGTFSPSNELCGSGVCLTAIDRVPLYTDNSHLTYSLSRFWADALSRQLGKVDLLKGE